MQESEGQPSLGEGFVSKEHVLKGLQAEKERMSERTKNELQEFCYICFVYAPPMEVTSGLLFYSDLTVNGLWFKV